MRYCDAHNHLQDDRFAPLRDRLVEEARGAGVVRMVVNGACEEDWPVVAELARQHPDLVVPSFGLHPWYVRSRSAAWFDRLQDHLGAVPGAVIGEIGLDRWILECPAAARAAVSGHLGELEVASLAEQEEVFLRQMTLAADRGLPATLHCLQAWGRLLELLRRGPRPDRGFLLHSYGGSADLVGPLARLGARFGFPGYFLHARKARQRAAFRRVPWDRLLVETDAPDQRLPPTPEWRHFDAGSVEVGSPTGIGAHRVGSDERGGERPEWQPWQLTDDFGSPLNHPANVRWVCLGLAEVLEVDPSRLAGAVASNFERLFGAPEGSA